MSAPRWCAAYHIGARPENDLSRRHDTHALLFDRRGAGCLGVEFGAGGHGDHHHRQLVGRLVLQGQRVARCVLLVQRGDHDDEGPHRAVRQHQLHLQGVHRQRVFHRQRAGERCGVPDQAGHARHAHGHGRPRRRQAEDRLVGGRQRCDQQVGVPAEGGQQQLRFLDRYLLNLHLAEPHSHRAGQHQELQVQGAGDQRHRHRRGIGRIHREDAGRRSAARSDRPQPDGQHRPGRRP